MANRHRNRCRLGGVLWCELLYDAKTTTRKTHVRSHLVLHRNYYHGCRSSRCELNCDPYLLPQIISGLGGYLGCPRSVVVRSQRRGFLLNDSIPWSNVLLCTEGR